MASLGREPDCVNLSWLRGGGLRGRIGTDDRNDETTWGRIIAREGPVLGLVAVAGASGSPVTCCTGSPGANGSCYLEDLFVQPDARGTGIGRALLQHLFDLGTANGWSHVYRMTQQKNAIARRLYDRFAAADDFVRYTVKLDTSP